MGPRHGAASVLQWIAVEVLPHERDVRSWLRGAVPADLEVSDVIQEAYSRMASLEHDRQIRSGRAYFFTIARNIVRDHFRHRNVVDFQPLAEIDRQGMMDSAPSAEQAFAARQELGIVWRLLDQLPSRCREILLLRKMDGLSQREVAQRLGVSENVVEQQIAFGTKRLLKLLAEETASSGDISLEPAWIGQRRRGR